jgi:hypothetical protein
MARGSQHKKKIFNNDVIIEPSPNSNLFNVNLIVLDTTTYIKIAVKCKLQSLCWFALFI